MAQNNILSKGIATVAVLTGAFGGIITHMMPPDLNGQSAGFVGTFSSLLIMLLISAIATYKNVHLKLVWIITGTATTIAFIFFSISYFTYRDKYYVEFPRDQEPKEYHLTGDSLSDKGKIVRNYLIKHRLELTGFNYLNNGGGTDNLDILWVDRVRVGEQLSDKYIVVMILLSIATFSVTEGVFVGSQQQLPAVHRDGAADRELAGNQQKEDNGNKDDSKPIDPNDEDNNQEGS